MNIFTVYTQIHFGTLNCGKGTSPERSFKFQHEEGPALIFKDTGGK